MKLFISGYGKMGRMIEKIILDRGLDYAGWTEAVTGTDPALAKECVCIDFTTPAAIRENYRFLAENFKAVVIGTTGWADIKDEVIAYFEKCGTPMIWASNFSIGVNVFFAVTDYISKTLGEPDESGRRSPVAVPGSEFEIETETVIMSLGTSPNPLIARTTAGLETNRRGCLVADENGATTRPGVFAGGDAVTGAATVILAMGAGRKAAAAIHEYVQNR